jgi:hypothetical protein
MRLAAGTSRRQAPPRDRARASREETPRGSNETTSGARYAAPPLVRSGPGGEELTGHIAGMLGVDRCAVIDAEWVDNGPGWVGLLLDSAETVLALRPGPVDPGIGVVGPYPAGTPSSSRSAPSVPRTARRSKTG